MADYTKYGWNKYLQAIDGYVTTRPQQVNGIEFSLMNSGAQLKNIRLSNVAIKNFVKQSNIGTASAPFTTGQVLYMTTVLTPLFDFKNFPNFAIPYVGVYQNVISGTSQIYPGQSTEIGTAKYRIFGANDVAMNGTNSVWKGIIENVSAGSVTIYFVTKWKYLAYNGGTVENGES
jgi:hypothetical protein